MTDPNVPPSEPTLTRPVVPAVASNFSSPPGAVELPTSRPVLVPGPLGRMSIGRIAVYVVGAIAVLFMAKTILYTDPVKEMTDELYRVGAAETVYRGTHPEFTSSLTELQRQDRKVKLHSQLVQFEAGKNGYQLIVRHKDTDKECTLIAGSFKPIGGEPEVTCATVSTPK